MKQWSEQEETGMVEPGGLPSMGLHRVRHDWSDLAAAQWDYFNGEMEVKAALQWVKWNESCSVVSDSLRPHGL